MNVRLCNGYRDAKIREVAESGLRRAQEVYLTPGNGPCCGTSLDCVQEIVDSVHTSGKAPARPVSDDSPADAVLPAAG